MRIKVGRACDVSLEYLGKAAYIVGTGAERARCASLLHLLQAADRGVIEAVPSEWEDCHTRLAVPWIAEEAVLGKKRANRHRLPSHLYRASATLLSGPCVVIRITRHRLQSHSGHASTSASPFASCTGDAMLVDPG